MERPLTDWRSWTPFPDPDAIARALARGQVTGSLWDKSREIERDAGRRTPFGLCCRISGGPCPYAHECERCPYLRVDERGRRRLEALEAETLTRLARSDDDGTGSEVASLAERALLIEEKLEQASPRPNWRQ